MKLLKNLKRAHLQIFSLFYKKCSDINERKMVCIKRIKDNKDFLDQAIQEVFFLNYINQHGNPNEYNFLKLIDCFYLNVS